MSLSSFCQHFHHQRQPWHFLLLGFAIGLWISISQVEGLSPDGHPSLIQSKALCRFRNQEYSPGDVWYPSSSSPTATSSSVNAHCIRCSCLNSGRLNCTKEDCPADCPMKSGSTDHPCCKFCTDGQSANPTITTDTKFSSPFSQQNSGGASTVLMGNENSNKNFPRNGFGSNGDGVSGSNGFGSVYGNSNNSPFANLANLGGLIDSTEDSDDDDDDGIGTENSEYVSCLHQGKIYRDGDSFTANITGLPIAAADQCMQCQCQGGMVLCGMKPCSSFKCGTSSSGSTSSSLITSSSTSTTTVGSKSTPSTTDSTSTTVVGDTCCQRCAASKGTNQKQQKPDEPRGNTIIRRPVSISPSNGGSRLGGYLPSFGNANNNNNNYVGANANNASKNGQGISGTSSTNNKFIFQQEIESSVTFRDVGSKDKESSISFSGTETNSARRQNEDCISAGRFYLHDSTWHPIVGPLGPMECLVCKCLHGNIECNRLKCPQRREFACSNPMKVEGHCCPVCTTTKDQILVPEGSSMCVSAKQNVTAYKSQGYGLNGTEIIEFAFLKEMKTSPGTQIELHEWTLTNGDIDAFTTDYLSKLQFDTLRNRQTFVLIGATNEKNVEKFTRREKKLEKRCLSKCRIRISSLERSLRLHRLISRPQCLLHERVVLTT